MKKMLLVGTSLLFAATSGFAYAAGEIEKKIEDLPMFKSVNADIVQSKEIGDLYQIRGVANKGQRSIFSGFVTKDFKTIVFGKAFDATSGQELMLDIDTNPLKKIAAFKRGKGKKEYFLFTDPECPYCIKLEKELVELKPDVTLYVILFPLDFHKNARSMSYYVLNQKNDAEKTKAMKSIIDGSDAYTKAAYTTEQINTFNTMIDEGMKLAEEYGIQGTPTILNAVGHRVGHNDLKK